MTPTIQANTPANGAFGSALTKNTRFSDASSPCQKQQGHLDGNHPPPNKRSGVQVVLWKDLSRIGFGIEKEDSLTEMSGKNTSGKQVDKSESVRKGKRISKKCVLDGEFCVDDDDDEEEIRYLEKLKTSKVSAVNKDDEELSKKHKKVSSMENAASLRLSQDGKKMSKSDGMYADTDHDEEE